MLGYSNSNNMEWPNIAGDVYEFSSAFNEVFISKHGLDKLLG